MTFESVEEASKGITLGNMDRAERTLQFYGLRKEWSWKQTWDKTREPTKAIKSTFGYDLDPITLMGLHPTHPVRPMTAYDRRWEIVDLGRNKKKAKLILEALTQEANAEHRLRQALDTDPMPKIHKWIEHDARMVKTTRKKVAERVADGDVYHLMRHYGGHDLKGLFMCETIGEIVVEIGKQLTEETTGEQALVIIERSLKKLEDKLMFFSDPCDDYSPTCFKFAKNIAERMGWTKAKKVLLNVRRDLAFVVNARNTIANRYSPPGIPTDLRR